MAASIGRHVRTARSMADGGPRRYALLVIAGIALRTTQSREGGGAVLHDGATSWAAGIPVGRSCCVAAAWLRAAAQDWIPVCDRAVAHLATGGTLVCRKQAPPRHPTVVSPLPVATGAVAIKCASFRFTGLVGRQEASRQRCRAVARMSPPRPPGQTARHREAPARETGHARRCCVRPPAAWNTLHGPLAGDSGPSSLTTHRRRVPGAGARPSRPTVVTA